MCARAPSRQPSRFPPPTRQGRGHRRRRPRCRGTSTKPSVFDHGAESLSTTCVRSSRCAHRPRCPKTRDRPRTARVQSSSSVGGHRVNKGRGWLRWIRWRTFLLPVLLLLPVPTFTVRFLPVADRRKHHRSLDYFTDCDRGGAALSSIPPAEMQNDVAPFGQGGHLQDTRGERGTSRAPEMENRKCINQTSSEK